MTRLLAPGENVDPIWGLPASSTPIGSGNILFHSVRSGNFAVSEGLRDYLMLWSDAEKAKLTTWILNHNRAGGPPLIKPADMPKIRARRSMTFTEKVDQFLLMLNASGFRPGDPLPWGRFDREADQYEARLRTMLWIEAASEKEFHAFGDILFDAGILQRDGSGILRLAARGHQRLDQLIAGGGDSDQAFVAMWFDESVVAAFTDGIGPAIEDAGYKPVRIDQKQHNNKIDDEILAEIRRSRFVVADFTCRVAQVDDKETAIARGGVYYEAGFAQGLGIPVIWCVRQDQVDKVHFDTRQFNHVTWSAPDDLRGSLAARISASIGWGPHARS